jgi:rRNA-processing protein EBP2
MKRKEKQSYKEKEQEEEEDLEDLELESEEHEGELPLTHEKGTLEEFGQRNVYNAAGLDALTKKLKKQFYNRLNSRKLIKKQGKVPFIEHMSIINDTTIVLPENNSVHKDLRRELCFYNATLQDTKNAVAMLIQSNVKIGRPDDYFAEMMKSDEHMRRIKSKILKQTEKIKQFEEKKLRSDNKKFRKSKYCNFSR